MRRNHRFLSLIVGLALCACAPRAANLQPTPAASPDGAGLPWPTQGWSTAAPEEKGVDGQVLAGVVADAQKADPYLHSLLVIRGGAIISETYTGEFTADSRHELYSVTKSFTSTLVGIAVGRGYLPDIQSTALSWFPNMRVENLDKRKQAITVEHLLTMTTGMDWREGDPIYRAMYQSEAWVPFVLGTAMRADPGSEFNYCSGCSHVLSALVAQSTGMKTQDFADKVLFAPLGIRNYNWETDNRGVPIGGWGLQITPRDMAKLGYLFLHNGEWEGQQVVPAEWVQAATQAHVDAGGGWDYGYQWWIDEEHGGYAAQGRYGQLIYVVPDKDLVVVATSAGDGNDALLQIIREQLLPALP